jgi:hypothetical protein
MKGLSVKPDMLEQTSRYWVGQGKQGIHLRRRAKGRLSLSLDQGHEGSIRAVIQEDSCSSMYKL